MTGFRAPPRPWLWLLQKGDLPSFRVHFFQGALHENQGDFREGTSYSPVQPLEPQKYEDTNEPLLELFPDDWIACCFQRLRDGVKPDV
jgi:hypothetical protein